MIINGMTLFSNYHFILKIGRFLPHGLFSFYIKAFNLVKGFSATYGVDIIFKNCPDFLLLIFNESGILGLCFWIVLYALLHFIDIPVFFFQPRNVIVPEIRSTTVVQSYQQLEISIRVLFNEFVLCQYFQVKDVGCGLSQKLFRFVMVVDALLVVLGHKGLFGILVLEPGNGLLGT